MTAPHVIINFTNHYKQHQTRVDTLLDSMAVCVTMQHWTVLLRVCFYKKIQDWILKSERIQKWILCFFVEQINP